MLRFALLVAAFAVSHTVRAEEMVDWSKFAAHGTMRVVVVKATTDSITIQVPKPGTKKPGGKTNKKTAPKPVQEEVIIPFALNGLVRYDKMPVKHDDKGVVRPATTKEMESARKPVGVPGYAAERGELKPGHILELTLVHPRDLPKDKVTQSDVSIKYATIVGETKAPASGEAPKKKK